MKHENTKVRKHEKDGACSLQISDCKAPSHACGYAATFSARRSGFYLIQLDHVEPFGFNVFDSISIANDLVSDTFATFYDCVSLLQADRKRGDDATVLYRARANPGVSSESRIESHTSVDGLMSKGNAC